MTTEEAIIAFEKQLRILVVALDSGFGTYPGENDRNYSNKKELAEMVFATLRDRKEMAEIALAALRAQQEQENPKTLTLDDLLEEEAESDIPMTNAERIRAMSDEEMAKFLCDFRAGNEEGHPCNYCVATGYCHQGHSGMIDWLQKLKEE